MQYNRMGRTGLKVSEICLGTMTFGQYTDQSEADKMVDLAFEAGVNFFDTANSYAKGASEEMLGKALGGRRRQAVLATKFSNPMGPGPNDSGMSRVHIMNAVEDSLRRLGTDWIDLCYVHHVDEQTPLEEMLQALDELVRQGKIRYMACSNYQAWRLGAALGISERERLHRFECYQPQYSLVVRDIEQELIPLCRHYGLGVAVWGPLANGFLTGKYPKGSYKLNGTRSEDGWVFGSRFFAANADDTLETLLQTAKKCGRSPAQVALRWTLQKPAISSAIVGARNAEQLRDNLLASTFRLDDAAMDELEAVSALPDRYPESMEKTMRQRRDEAVNMPTIK